MNLKHRSNKIALTVLCRKRTNQFETQQLKPNMILQTTSLKGSAQILGMIRITRQCNMKTTCFNSKIRLEHAQVLCEESVRPLRMRLPKRTHSQLTVKTKKSSRLETI